MLKSTSATATPHLKSDTCINQIFGYEFDNNIAWKAMNRVMTTTRPNQTGNLICIIAEW